MITFWHLLLMLWLGGAITITYFLYAFARVQPEEFEDSGLAGTAAIIAIIFWPYAMFRAVQLVEQEINWRQRQAKHEPKLEAVPIPPPPPVCSHCMQNQQEACERANKALASFQYCEDCAIKMKAWREESWGDGHVSD